ncbi:MAG: ketoacyl-ACP synthase III [Actinomycetota bacterium]|nr:ketoacyl-ACP synthase III [Actinomycetota bacterium]
MSGAALTGWGAALPDKVVTNDDLAAYLDTSDQWIRERTGIRERHIGGTTTELAVDAARAALARAGLQPADIDLVVLSTTTPDQMVPGNSAEISARLGTAGGAMDVNAACAGFVYALVAAHGLLGRGIEKALVIGSDTLSRITDWDDRSTAVLFGDAAGAVVMEHTGGADQLLGWDLGVDGTARRFLYCDHGSTLYMEGREVFRRAVRAVVSSCEKTLQRAGVDGSQVALCVPHQANIRIIEAANERLGIPMDRTAIALDRTGNTSSASVPLALAEAADEGRVADGDLVLLCGFGAGMTWSSAVLRWGK